MLHIPQFLSVPFTTLDIILSKLELAIPVIQDAALNERDYGSLQGLNKEEVAKQYGTEKVLEWRRSFDTAPPDGESLKDTYNRVIPYYEYEIKPRLKEGETVLIVAHGNSLRALIMYLEQLTPQQIVEFNIDTGIPKVYEFSTELQLINEFDLIS